jgi:hypothetical protein
MDQGVAIKNKEHTAFSGVVLPLPPDLYTDHDNMAVYARFMRHLRNVPSSRKDIRVLAAIQFTADMTGHSDAHIGKILVDLGLRAPRMAFPADFLRYADQALLRMDWQVGGPSPGLLALKAYWDETGEDRFAGLKGGADYAVCPLVV